ncbi:hypothetical protein [Sanguibacter antarcticus]|uniref:Uncharacterized protein n=1 Tax=Sanguibacter antarcticus TaxID=372484 RepID=A0A2A9E3Q9_9MICO|nr:hypothetical protein [Sanguibacter antarcticus]PFG33588.1 hypothetical protein ATL42_1465 [Sanguibacter antarcticus]
MPRVLPALDWAALVRGLWAVLGDVRSLGFSLDPREVRTSVRALRGLVTSSTACATGPAPGGPAALRAEAERWAALTVAVGETSLPTLGGASDDAAGLTDDVRRTLEASADALAAARARRIEVGVSLRSVGRRVRGAHGVAGSLSGVRDAIRAARVADAGAAAAARACDHALDVVDDQVSVAPHGVVGQVAFRAAGSPDALRHAARPLVGDTARRAQEAYDSLPAAGRETVDRALASMPGDEHRAWVLASLASGAAPTTLVRFADRIAPIDATRLATALDPTDPRLTSRRTLHGVRIFQQSTGTTCGSVSLVVARMLTDPVYALWMLDAYDATTGEASPHGSTSDGIAYRFTHEERQVQKRTSSCTDRSARTDLRPVVRTRLAWPTALGTPPWGASEEMSSGVGPRGTRYRVTMIDSDSPARCRQAVDDVARAVDRGRPVPVFTGSDSVPRHVVLVVGRGTDGALQVFNPATGTVRTISEQDFVAGGDELRAVGSWPRAWAAVTPVTSAELCRTRGTRY